MKKLFALLLALALLIPAAVSAEADEQPLESGEWGYRLLEDGSAEIVEYNRGKNDSAAEELEIPLELDGHAVTAIAGNPFTGCDDLTTIRVSPNHPAFAVMDGALYSKADKRLVCVPRGLWLKEFSIPQGIRIIGDGVFYGCWSLTAVIIPDSVTSIGDSAFSGCWKLTAVTIPDSVASIGPSAFSGCISLTAVTIQGSMTSIGDHAFSGCWKLTAVTIPDSVTSIGDDVFASCWSLTAVTIPDSVTSIGNYAFYRCSSLTDVTIPDSVTSIGDLAFYNCESLAAVTVGPGSYAEQYCIDNELPYIYPNSLDWLTD